MSGELLLGIDEGTTAVKAALFDEELALVAQARRPLALKHPGPGRVEQDPLEIEAAVIDAVAEVLAAAGGRPVAATGLDHQGESVVAWDARSGEPLTPVLVWQDKRQEELLSRVDAEAVSTSGLPLDPYFSAGKIAWLLQHDEAVRAARAQGALRVGTLDAFLSQRLGAPCATDLSTASRTQLLARGGRDWDARLLEAFAIEREWLPEIAPTFGELGELRHPSWPAALALRARLVDQQAALAGSGAVAPGELKATYGTGVFVLAHTDGPARVDGLLPTVAWAGADGEVHHALDGGVFAAGSLLEWLAGLGLAPDPPALAALAATVQDCGGVKILPAIAGLGAPWWQPRARGVIAGLHGGSTAAHVARAALHAVAMRVADIVEAVERAGPVREVRADGGLSNDALLMQMQADALGRPVLVGRADATVLGAAMLAGVGAGTFATVAQAAGALAPGRAVEPRAGAGERAHERERWRAFVAGAAALEDYSTLAS